jgi:hypothetical protein
MSAEAYLTVTVLTALFEEAYAVTPTAPAAYLATNRQLPFAVGFSAHENVPATTGTFTERTAFHFVPTRCVCTRVTVPDDAGDETAPVSLSVTPTFALAGAERRVVVGIGGGEVSEMSSTVADVPTEPGA